MLQRLREPWTDRQAGWRLGAIACLVLVVILLMVVFVTIKAWPTLVHNGFVEWLGPGGNVDEQTNAMIQAPQHPPASAYHLRAWPLVYATIVTSVVAVGLGLLVALFTAIFIVEFAPERLRDATIPAVRLLAAVPSVVYGLIGILVVVPFVNNHIISTARKDSVKFVVQLDGTGLAVACLILMVMVVPIMVAIIVDALRAIPRGWTEGSEALGANRWETVWSISVKAARPAIIAAGVLAGARALGEAIMLSMVSGSRGFAPNLLDGLTFIFEPVRPIAASMVENVEAMNSPPIKSTIYAFALLLLFSSLMLSIAGYVAKLPMRRQGIRV